MLCIMPQYDELTGQEAPFSQIETDLDTFKRRFISGVEGCFRDYMMPVELTGMMGRFNRWAKARNLIIVPIVEQMVADGLIRIQVLSSGKRMVWSMRDWNSMDETSRERALHNVADLYLKKGSVRTSNVARDNVRENGYPEIPSFFPKVEDVK